MSDFPLIADKEKFNNVCKDSMILSIISFQSFRGHVSVKIRPL